jgi:hypothetical protein
MAYMRNPSLGSFMRGQLRFWMKVQTLFLKKSRRHFQLTCQTQYIKQTQTSSGERYNDECQIQWIGLTVDLTLQMKRLVDLKTQQ